MADARAVSQKKTNPTYQLLELLVSRRFWSFLKWSLMTSALFWILVYHLSQSARRVPEFVYVNF